VTAPPSILVDCVVRSDATTKSGGDMIQLREYAPYLRAWGVDLREVPFHPAMRLRPGAIVHVLNIDRPFEFLAACLLARGHRRVVSPIHHNVQRVRAMRATERGRGIKGFVSRVIPEPEREWLGMCVRAARRSRGARDLVRTVGVAALTLPALANIWRRVGRELDAADGVALLAEGEGTDLRALTGWRGANAFLAPNGRPEDVDSALGLPWRSREQTILVVGRIEPRKRPLEIGTAAHAAGVRVTFIGQQAEGADAYVRRFRALVESSPYVVYHGPRDRPGVLAAMGEARVLLNGSWVEVQSLVDLEAAFMGCAVVATDAGHSHEWLGEAVTVVPGTLAELVATSASIARDDDRIVAAPAYDWTWERASRALMNVYVEGAIRDTAPSR
jgi:glycosyltransferase involved in cell wall biosynthesis